MLHYMDNTIDYLEISYQEISVNQGIAEYRMKWLQTFFILQKPCIRLYSILKSSVARAE